MKNRRKAREAVMQALYQCDATSDWSLSSVELFFSYFHSFSKDEQIDTPDQAPSEKSNTEVVDFDLEKRTAAKNMTFAKNVACGVLKNLDMIDAAITEASSHWNIARMSRVDRNILRLGVYELYYLADTVPLNVALNEAIEIAKKFGTDDSATFVNGILDNVARTIGGPAAGGDSKESKRAINA